MRVFTFMSLNLLEHCRHWYLSASPPKLYQASRPDSRRSHSSTSENHFDRYWGRDVIVKGTATPPNTGSRPPATVGTLSHEYVPLPIVQELTYDPLQPGADVGTIGAPA
jgi:hypothetical protein